MSAAKVSNEIAASNDRATPGETQARLNRIDEMREMFKAMPKVQVRVQEDTPVTINGYGFLIKGKQRVMVPELVAEVLEQSGLI